MDLRPILSWLQGRKYVVLLVTLFLLTVLDPLLADFHLGRLFFDVSFCVVLAATIFAVGQHKRPLWTALILGVPALVLTWSVYGVRPDTTAGIVVVSIRHITNILFLGLMAGLILYDVFRGKNITGDKICGAICVYFLVGVAWGTLYSLVDQLTVESFVVNSEIAATFGDDAYTADHMSVYIYYSFVTLSTLGYGDMTPVAAPLRTFAWLEAVMGQLYIAVLVARLVGLHIVQSGDA